MNQHDEPASDEMAPVDLEAALVGDATAGIDAEPIQRLEERHLVSVPAEIRVEERSFAAITRDLSSSGAALLTRVELKPGDLIGVQFHLHHHSSDVLHGEVVRVEPWGFGNNPMWRYSVAVEFPYLPESCERDFLEISEMQARLGITDNEVEDRRSDERHTVFFPSHLVPDQGEPRVAMIRNLSEGGASVLSQRKLAPGTRVMLNLFLSKDAELARLVIGEVVRCEPWTRGIEIWRHVVGIKFLVPLHEYSDEIHRLEREQNFARSNGE